MTTFEGHEMSDTPALFVDRLLQAAYQLDMNTVACRMRVAELLAEEEQRIREDERDRTTQDLREYIYKGYQQQLAEAQAEIADLKKQNTELYSKLLVANKNIAEK